MYLPFSTHHTPSEPPAVVRVVTREDVLWNRPVFKAPPLNVRPPEIDASLFHPAFRPVAEPAQR